MKVLQQWTQKINVNQVGLLTIVILNETVCNFSIQQALINPVWQQASHFSYCFSL